MAKILMLINQFSNIGEPADPPHQLADAFVAAGHSVKVVVIPWQRNEARVQQYSEHERLQVLRVPPLQVTRLGRAAALLLRWTFSSLVARHHAKNFIADDDIDLIYTTSPSVSMAFLIRWALRKFPQAQSYLYIVDFFPFHQRAIGVIPGGPVFRIAKWAESGLIRMFNTVACMSPKNVDYLKTHYVLRPGQEVEILPLSTAIMLPLFIDKKAVRARYRLPEDKVIAIFGGQITEGRGIEQIIETARLASRQVPELHFVLAGHGRLVHLVEAYIELGGQNLSLISSLARDAYIELAVACDIGLVVTVPISDIPTFPSKTLDYLQAGLPVVAAVEADTDFRGFVEKHGFGVVVEAGSAQVLLDALAPMVRDAELRYSLAQSGKRALHDVFEIGHSANQITKRINKTNNSDIKQN
jgi:glycosyltransferase involved in cell wall biosynthesis